MHLVAAPPERIAASSAGLCDPLLSSVANRGLQFALCPRSTLLSSAGQFHLLRTLETVVGDREYSVARTFRLRSEGDGDGASALAVGLGRNRRGGTVVGLSEIAGIGATNRGLADGQVRNKAFVKLRALRG